MRHRLSLFVVLSALFLSGWGHALAAAVCPHAAERGAGRAADEVPACCRTEGGEAEHCPMKTEAQTRHARPPEALSAHASSHEASGGGHESAGRPASAVRGSGKASRPAGSCLNCAGCSTPPPARMSLRAPETTRRDADHARASTQKFNAATAADFRPEVVPVQGAPPGPPAQRRHVLVSVFLI